MSWYKTAQVDPNAGVIVYNWPGEGQVTAKVISVDTNKGFYLVNHGGRQLQVYPQQVVSVQPKEVSQQPQQQPQEALPQITQEQWIAIGKQNGWL
tara:strand:- start:1428 stop:1712 length:285 start_codon:yes stop_codon:yes gene_type:complete